MGNHGKSPKSWVKSWEIMGNHSKSWEITGDITGDIPGKSEATDITGDNCLQKNHGNHLPNHR